MSQKEPQTQYKKLGLLWENHLAAGFPERSVGLVAVFFEQLEVFCLRAFVAVQVGEMLILAVFGHNLVKPVIEPLTGPLRVYSLRFCH